MFIRCVSLALLLFTATAVPANEMLDRLVAVLNGHVILLSECDEELQLEFLMAGRKLAEVGPGDRKAALDRLIDQELLRERMRATDFRPVTSEEVQKQMDSLKTDYLREHAGESWELAVLKYHLSEQFLRVHVEAELEQLQFVDARFRPSIQVSSDEIEKYYRDQLVPKLPPGDPVSLAEAIPKIREILVQEKINQGLASWLQTLRAQAQRHAPARTPRASTHRTRPRARRRARSRA